MKSGNKIRVYELGRELNIPNKELVTKIQGLNIVVNNHMSSVSPSDAVKIKQALGGKGTSVDSSKAAKPAAPTVIRRRSKKVVTVQEDESSVSIEAQPAEAVAESSPDKEDIKKTQPLSDVEAVVAKADTGETVPVESELSDKEEYQRPEVGTIIDLPTPRIKITERAPAEQPHARSRNRVKQTNTQRQGRRDSSFGRKRVPVVGRKSNQTQITTPAEHKRIIKIQDTIVLQDFAKAMGVKGNELLKKLWDMGMMGININAVVDFDTANIVGTEFGYDVQNVAFQEEVALDTKNETDVVLGSRAPVITVMGHVDHGKTTLLDKIRSSKIASGEAGGITQHIAAYHVELDRGDMVFLDTPGHEAFTSMRVRGAKTTDIVVLVVSADDGVMPQTVEAVKHAKAAEVIIIVAVNKIDAPNAKPERIRQQLAEYDLIPEEWGGDTQYIDISALNGDGIDKLLEAIILQSELLDLKANPNKSATGTVIEGRLDKSRGSMTTVLVQDGTLRMGDTVVAGDVMGKVRAMLNDRNEPVTEVGPSRPVEVFGLDGVPNAGEMLNVTNEKTARQVVDHRRQQKRQKELASNTVVSLENLIEKIQEGSEKELKIVLKTDVQGSSEALRDALIKTSTDKVAVNVIFSGVGGITESDVNLAKAGNAIVVGFHVRCAGKSAKLAESESVPIQLYNVIYEAIDDVKKAMTGLLAPILRENKTGSLDVMEVFFISKIGAVAGSMVTDGKITRQSLLRVIRDSVQIYEGKVGTLRRFKDDVSSVQQGYECGLSIQGFNDLNPGDVIESYEIIEELATL